jgi:hypothetical protein
MPPLLVASASPGAGRTTVTAGLAWLAASSGREVAVRRAGDDDAARADAAFYAGVPAFAAPPEPAALESLKPSGGIDLWEAPPGDIADAAAKANARVLLVARRELDAASRRLAERLGDRLAGIVLTAVPEKEAAGVTSPVIAALPEDRLLAGPSVRDVRDALQARTLLEDGADAALEWIVVAPIASDPGAPYFTRWGRKAVVVRHEKADLMLAALGTELDCLIITGGREPLPYVLDRIRNEGRDLTVLLSPLDTYRTMRRIEKLYGASRFAGMRKVERAAQLLRERLAVPVETLLA